jgi:hypothetical protein
LGRWQRYWFAEGGRVAAAVVRMALATAVLLTLWRLATLSTVHLPGPPELYRPVGIWMLLGRTPPPKLVVDALWALAWTGSVAMLAGYFTRLATAVSCGAALALASLSFASSATWSHQYNVVFLAQIAFLGARGGDVLSVDALMRRWRRLPAIDAVRAYQWSLRLVQLAVALMFAGAAFHKLLHGHFTLRWALSDNLRHQLLVRFDLAGLPRPPLVDWIIDDVWRYRIVAVMNLISQSMPILACIFVRRPLVRALGGAFFALEVMALALVVGLWNLHWLPLAAVFIDWDRLVAFIARRPEVIPATPPETLVAWRPPLARRIFIIAFLVYDAVTALVPKADQWLNTYPFSGFPMFATVRARAPYDEHLPYTIPGDHFEVLSDRPLTDRQQSWLDQTYRRLESVRDPEVLRKKLTAILRDVQQRFPDAGIRGIRHYLVMFEAPAFPAPAHFEAHPIAITGEIDRDGRFRTVLGALGTIDVTLQPRGVDATSARLRVYRDDDLGQHELPSERTGDRFLTGPLEGDPLYVVATIDGQAWLVGSRKVWRWE